MDYKTESFGEITVISVFLQRATLKNAAGFKEYVLHLINNGNAKLIVDLSVCEYIDSTFLGALVAALKKAASLNGDLRLVYSSKASTLIFDLTSMNKVFKIYHELDEALDGFGETDTNTKRTLTWK